MAQQITVTFEDQRFRTFRATFTRERRGSFAKLVKIERYTGNGKHEYWTLHRASCHGELELHTKEKLKEMAHIVRYQP